MGDILSIGLMNNAALLLALSVIYEVIYMLPSRFQRIRPVINGILTALVCFIIMKIPFTVQPGLFFDTRSILISVTAVLFGPIPAGITAITAIFLRISVGGIGTLPGIAVITASTLIGLVWRRFLLPKQKKWRWANMYVMSITVHVVMLACMLLLPYPDNLSVVRTIAVPVLVIYPVASMLLSVLILNQQERRAIQDKLVQSEESHRRLFETMSQGVVYQGADGEILSANSAAERILGQSLDQMQGKTSMDPEWKSIREDGSEIAGSEHPSMIALRTGERVGPMIMGVFQPHLHDHVWLSINAIPLFRPGETVPFQVYTTFEDITKRRQSEEALKESEDKFKYFFDNSGVGKSVTMVSGEIHVNNAFCIMLGYTADELENRNWREITHPDDIDLTDKEIKALLAREKDIMRINKRYIRKDGAILWTDVTSSARWDAAGNPVYFMTSIIDITQQKNAEEKLLHYSYRDHLTGLYNRRYFEEQLHLTGSGDRVPTSIIMCDINGLKLVNDTFGHTSGDKLIRIAAEVISKTCRPDDTVARIGGDEFAVLLPQTDAAETAKIVDRIRVQAANFKVFHIELSISIGSDTRIEIFQKIDDIMTNAENDMYKHKMYEQSSIRGKTIDVVMHMLFEKSSRESMHSLRVSTISQAIASSMDFDKDMISRIRIAGLVHDIGKIGVNENILNRAGSLGDEQWKEIKRHTEIGWRILSAANEFSELAAIVLAHHERWDGGGYPNNLSGEAIPIEARIIAVADAFDAMTSERSYRMPYSRDKAVQELMRHAGTQFDPKVVEVFINEVLPGFVDHAEEYAPDQNYFL
ncbi:MAG: PAS domain S-box protein [Saccharofermentanales bacterium]